LTDNYDRCAAPFVFFSVAIAHADFRECREVPVDPAPDAALTRAAEATLKAELRDAIKLLQTKSS